MSRNDGKGVSRGGLGKVRGRNCYLSHNLKMHRKEPGGKEKGEDDSGLTLASVLRHASRGECVLCPALGCRPHPALLTASSPLPLDSQPSFHSGAKRHTLQIRSLTQSRLKVFAPGPQNVLLILHFSNYHMVQHHACLSSPLDCKLLERRTLFYQGRC